MQLDLLGGRGEQLALPLAIRRSGHGTVATSEQMPALAYLADATPRPGSVTVLLGPAGAGKSHLGREWAALRGAVSLGPSGLGRWADAAAARAVWIDDVHLAFASPARRAAERAAFHLVNAVRAGGGELLLTTRTDPRGWGLTLADLRSRLAGATRIEIDAPGQGALRTVGRALCERHQLVVAERDLAGLCLAVERSHGALEAALRRADAWALARGRRIDARMLSDALRA